MPEKSWRRLTEIEKGCHFNTISAEELLISKYMTAITNKKTKGQKFEKKNTGTEKKSE